MPDRNAEPIGFWVEAGGPLECKVIFKVGSADEASTVVKLAEFCDYTVSMWQKLTPVGKANLALWFCPKHSPEGDLSRCEQIEACRAEAHGTGGILYLQVHGATGLAARDRAGMFNSKLVSSDPFVVVKLNGDTIGETEVSSCESLTPLFKKNMDVLSAYSHDYCATSLSDA